MNIQQRLDAIIAQWNLLNHPFYKAWSNGTLPVERLKEYAGEYASFIKTVADGWDACNYTSIANTEREHYILWQNFARSLDKNSFSATLPDVQKLVSDCEANNSSVPTALGSLYAFEAQQPYTAQSKLKGLRDHYNNLQCDETYFKVHENDFDEPAIIAEQLELLSDADKNNAVSACETTCKNLWNALSAIHNDPAICN